jgi:hypothetical protein
MRIERPGRIVLEDPDVLLENLQEEFSAALGESAGDADAVIDSLLAGSCLSSSAPSFLGLVTQSWVPDRP